MTIPLAKVGDYLAIPFFALLIYYFLSIKNRTIFENILLLFVTIAILCDTTFLFFNLYT